MLFGSFSPFRPSSIEGWIGRVVGWPFPRGALVVPRRNFAPRKKKLLIPKSQKKKETNGKEKENEKDGKSKDEKN